MSTPTPICDDCMSIETHPGASRSGFCGVTFYQRVTSPFSGVGYLRWRCRCVCEREVKRQDQDHPQHGEGSPS